MTKTFLIVVLTMVYAALRVTYMLRLGRTSEDAVAVEHSHANALMSQDK